MPRQELSRSSQAFEKPTSLMDWPAGKDLDAIATICGKWE